MFTFDYKKKQEELKEKRFGSKSNKSYTFDFAGRKIIDEKIDINFKNYAKDIENILKSTNYSLQTSDLINQDLKMTPQVFNFEYLNMPNKNAFNKRKEMI